MYVYNTYNIHVYSICIQVYNSGYDGGCGGGVSARTTDNGFGLHPAKMNYSTLDDCGGGGGATVSRWNT